MKILITSPHITDQERRIHYKYGLFLLLCAFIFAAGCNQTFEPLQENNKYFFTLFGYLDASADTQWVRVGTVRQSIKELPNPIGIQVLLEDIESGQTDIMNDSVFTSINVLNYWSTMDIKNEKPTVSRWQVKMEKQARLPSQHRKKLSSPFIITNPGGANIYIDDSVDHIADVQSVWYVILNPGAENIKRIYRFPIRNTLRHTLAFFGAYTAFANWRKNRSRLNGALAMQGWQ
jgi:hypothetical protein